MRCSFLVVSLFLMAPTFANDAGSCYALSNADARVLCLARAHKDPGRCYSIISPDVRAACLAEVRQDKR